MESQKINRIKIALVKNGKTGKCNPSLDTSVRIYKLLNVDVKDLIVSNKA